MKIDYLVVNIDSYVQEDEKFINKVHSIGLLYEPKWGKGTKDLRYRTYGSEMSISRLLS